MNRKEAITLLARAALRGRLGLFVGTGFSMAASAGRAPNFVNLLHQVAEEMGLAHDFSTEDFALKSLPQIATKLVLDLAEARRISVKDAAAEIRRSITRICNVVPDAYLKAKFESALKAAAPSWIVTTNYDLILEALVEDSQSILPNEALFPNKDRVPIYHLHGHRHYPDSIKVTEEDYVGLLAPLDYQRLKLPLLFLESTTLLLGYKLGDLNVRAAIEWSKSFKAPGARAPTDPDGAVVLAIYSEKPRPNVRIGPHEEIILETNDVAAFLEEVGTEREELDRIQEYVRQEIADFLADKAAALKISEDGHERETFLAIVESTSDASPNAIVEFLDQAITPVWTHAREDGGFQYYDDYLDLLICILKRLRFRESSPAITFFIASALDRVGDYYAEDFPRATAHEATRRWMKEAPTLDPDLLAELRNYAAPHAMFGLGKLLNCSKLRPPPAVS